MVSPLFLTSLFRLIPFRFSEYMALSAVISCPCFLMIASRSFHVVANFTFIRFNPVFTNLPYVVFANNLYRFFSAIVLDLARFSFNMFTYSNMNEACLLDLARFSFNMFTYSNMNEACLRSVYVKSYERNQPK